MLAADAGSLVAYPFGEHVGLPIMAVYAQQSRLTTAADCFIECLRNVLSAQTI
jgi:hypothetical protein